MKQLIKAILNKEILSGSLCLCLKVKDSHLLEDQDVLFQYQVPVDLPCILIAPIVRSNLKVNTRICLFYSCALSFMSSLFTPVTV